MVQGLYPPAGCCTRQVHSCHIDPHLRFHRIKLKIILGFSLVNTGKLNFGSYCWNTEEPTAYAGHELRRFPQKTNAHQHLYVDSTENDANEDWFGEVGGT
jgi:hypothetical protein